MVGAIAGHKIDIDESHIASTIRTGHTRMRNNDYDDELHRSPHKHPAIQLQRGVTGLVDQDRAAWVCL